MITFETQDIRREKILSTDMSDRNNFIFTFWFFLEKIFWIFEKSGLGAVHCSFDT